MLAAFLPKANIYYLLESKLVKSGIILSEDSVEESFAGLNLNNIDVSFGGSNMAHAQKVEAFFGIFYNKIELTSATPASSMRNFIPEMNEISAWYTPFYPTKVFLKGKGDIGSISGSYNIYDSKIHLELKPSSNSSRKYPMVSTNFKNIDGRLVYELSLK
jgi:hypothetical protein